MAPIASAPQPTALVAVDWGTSSLRAARLGADGQVLGERSSDQGILKIQPGQFATVLEAICAGWTGKNDDFSSKTSILCLISGMAGSKQGWVEAPYCPCPAGFDEVAANIQWIEAGRVAIIPGLCCEHTHAPDVMRGEEVQIFGAMQLTGQDNGLFVLPGTHSKWAQVNGGRIEGFTTYMTGEVFALLSQHSILAKTVDAAAAFDEVAFLRGVDTAQQGLGLLHTAFSARTLGLFSRQSPPELASYLSGLVIGEELHLQLTAKTVPSVVLIGSGALTHRYQLALAHCGVASRCLGSESTWAGLHALAQTLKS